MDKLLAQNNVSDVDIKNLAVKISAFHKTANVIHEKNIADMKQLFDDLLTRKNYLDKYDNCATLIENAISMSDIFFDTNVRLLQNRDANNFIRDCHGDLHSRNIFLLPEPVPFDCLEFSDELRQIDILDEVAFLCMDLETFGRKDLSDLFFNEYNRIFPIANSIEEQNLFIFYKAYRANIRAKVNSFRAQDAGSENERIQALENVHKYLQLMNSYLTSIVGLAA
jgi:aminoglycoside phosphotransferase family enzyme